MNDLQVKFDVESVVRKLLTCVDCSIGALENSFEQDSRCTFFVYNMRVHKMISVFTARHFNPLVLQMPVAWRVIGELTVHWGRWVGVGGDNEPSVVGIFIDGYILLIDIFY